MSIEKIYEDLRGVRRLARCGLLSNEAREYQERFKILPQIQCTIMTECYINGLSYDSCGRIVGYCERQVQRIVRRSVKQLAELQEG